MKDTRDSRGPWWLVAAVALTGLCACGDDGGDDDTADAHDTAEATDDARPETTEDVVDGEPEVEPEAETEAEADAEPEAEAEAEAEADAEPEPCDGLTDTNCLEIQLGERTFYRHLDTYDTVDIDDEGTTRTCVALPDIIDEAITATPEEYRYQGFGTDGYTFGGYATWTNVLNGYIELGNRRLYWDPAEMLPNSWNVRDTYLIVLSPAGG